MKNLYKFFKFNNKVIDIFGFDNALLDIYSQKVLEMIKNNEEGWEKMIPKKVIHWTKSNTGLLITISSIGITKLPIINNLFPFI